MSSFPPLKPVQNEERPAVVRVLEGAGALLAVSAGFWLLRMIVLLVTATPLLMPAFAAMLSCAIFSALFYAAARALVLVARLTEAAEDSARTLRGLGRELEHLNRESRARYFTKVHIGREAVRRLDEEAADPELERRNQEAEAEEERRISAMLEKVQQRNSQA
jgi:hypothetical protein